MHGITEKNLRDLFKEKNPFAYDLGIRVVPAHQKNANVIVCCHGYGADNHIVDAVSQSGALSDHHLIGFNFPDYNCVSKAYNPNTSSFGSTQELLPLLYIMKKIVIDAHLGAISLYGFSAGGAAVINALAVLNSSTYDNQLASIGIGQSEKEKIKNAVQHGDIILECPLKSIEEIIDFRGNSPEFQILANRYNANEMRPIDVIEKLKGLALTIFIHFEKPDDILSNRDDKIFIDRLKKANVTGNTIITTGTKGGHNSFHPALWKEYKKYKKGK